MCQMRPKSGTLPGRSIEHRELARLDSAEVTAFPLIALLKQQFLTGRLSPFEERFTVLHFQRPVVE